MKYRELQAECKRLGLNGKGSKKILQERLDAYNAGDGVPADDVPRETSKPSNPNFNPDGTWKRRPRGFIEWAEDGSPIVE